MKTLIATTIALLLLGTSCMTHRHTIGEGPVGARGKTKIHSRAKQMYLFWGLVPLGRPEPHRPNHHNYQIKTGANFGDAVLSTITLGLVQWRTIRILVHAEETTPTPQTTATPTLQIGNTVVYKEPESSQMKEATIIGITGENAIIRYKGAEEIIKEVPLSQLTKITVTE